MINTDLFQISESSSLLILLMNQIKSLDKCFVDALVEVAKFDTFEILDITCHTPLENTLNHDFAIEAGREAEGTGGNGWNC